MLYNPTRTKLCRHLLVGGALCVAGLAGFSCSDEYADMDDDQPSGLSTIYGYMESKGNYKNFLQLIEDLDQKEILSKTGSKTLFVADDDAFKKFYEKNDWGVGDYKQLSLSQKKLLLNAAMIDNPYSASMLSTAEGPVRGEVCRRATSQTIYDSVQIVSLDDPEIPQNNPRWDVLRTTNAGTRESIVLFKDASGAPPMIHFTPKFLGSNQIPSTDIDWIYGDPEGTRQSDDVYVNNSKVKVTQFCKNGFIHEVDRVITPLDNMAELIRKNPNTSIYSTILERFAVPQDSVASGSGTDLTKNYKASTCTNPGKEDVDSVFVKRYFSKRSSGTTTSTAKGLAYDKGGNTFDASLKFDPGWNTLISDVFNNRTALMEDMAVMIVPTDAAMREWEQGNGADIMAMFGSLDNTPNSVLVELLNVGMLESFVGSVPTRFNTILNDANLPIGIQKSDVDQVLIGCNGLIYVTNKVFAPASYSSVLYPAVIDTENMNIIYNAIKNLDYDKYLNSMAMKEYSFFIPTNKGMFAYIDPVSFGKAKLERWEFGFDRAQGESSRIYADVYEADPATGERANDTKLRTEKGSVKSGNLYNRFIDILDNIIGLEKVVPGKHYYITKGKNFIKVGGTADVAGQMTAGGSYQAENDKMVTVDQVFQKENGYAYALDGIMQTSRKATSDILAEHEEFSDFYEILIASGMVGNTTSDGYCSASVDQGTSLRGNLVSTTGAAGKTQKNYSLLNGHHYTIYAPTNAAMQEAYAKGMPSMDDLREAEAFDEEQAELQESDESIVLVDSAEHVKAVMRDFIRYHIQSGGIFLDGGDSEAGQYETMKTQLTKTPKELDSGELEYQNADGSYYVIAGSPYRITVLSSDESHLEVKDASGQTVNIQKQQGAMGEDLCNILGREYWLNGKDPEKASTIQNSSSVVVHAIDHPLLYGKQIHDATHGDILDQFIYMSYEVISE